MAPPHACKTGIGADGFVVLLRHLADAAVWSSGPPFTNERGGGAAGRQLVQSAAGTGSHPDALTATRLRLMLARLECAWKTTQEMVSSASVLLCLGAFKATLCVVMLNNTSTCLRCGSGSSRKDGVQVDKITSLYWFLTNMIVQLRGLRTEKVFRRQTVQEFLSRHQISSALSIRVRRHVERSQPQLHEANANGLRLSTELVVDLLEEMHIPAFSTHPFFVNLRTKHPDLVRELCHEALQMLLLAPDEIVFLAGETCSRMYVIVSGHAQYAFQPRDGAGPAQIRRTLHGGHWLSEAALWTSWVHRGELRVITDCLLFTLEASSFARIISSHESAHRFAATYARKFVESLNRGPQTDLVEAGSVDQ